MDKEIIELSSDDILMKQYAIAYKSSYVRLDNNF